VDQAAAPPPELDDAGDLRGEYFRLLLKRPLTLVLVAGAAIAAGLAGAAIVGPAVGGAAFVGAAILALLVVLAIADSRSEDAFFEHYAEARGMATSSGGRRELPPMTSLLQKGDDRWADRVLEGPLGEGVEGLLAHYTYEERHSDGKGGQNSSTYDYTVALTEVVESITYLPELVCQRRFGLRALEGLEDAFRSKERVTLESSALGERYEIFVGKGQDPGWVRQLFSPAFIVFLTESAPEKFAFELDNGHLTCFVNGHRESEGELDVLRSASAAVATRLREESLESLPGS
jgi:hypothetical protein